MSTLRVTTKLDIILQAVQYKVMQAGLFNEATVVFSLLPELLDTPANDHFLVIKPLTQTVEQASVVGGGRDYQFMQGELGIYLWTRLAIDRFPQDYAYLNNITLGALRVNDNVMGTLQLFDPTNTDGNCILGEPMRLVRTETIEKVSLPGWGVLNSVWEIHYTQDLSIT